MIMLIVRCLGISTDQRTNEYLLVMQYANGGDLQNYLKKNFKNLTWNDKKKLAFQIADGLNYLHNENVLHRDLHSKNVVIHENNAKITDFGISKFQNNQSSTAYIVTVPNTPDDYEKLYKNCWNQEPEQRPNINEVLDEFERMDFGINVKNKSVTVSMRE
ncbi:unnamed protein product [Rhizophagus irregularis]|nr:unnamed protein product [Rhizophagus irregularis]